MFEDFTWAIFFRELAIIGTVSVCILILSAIFTALSTGVIYLICRVFEIDRSGKKKIKK
jgi:hypothetical protein